MGPKGKIVKGAWAEKAQRSDESWGWRCMDWVPETLSVYVLCLQVTSYPQPCPSACIAHDVCTARLELRDAIYPMIV
jgi:hypothetical protein